jgi:hypothetical protein
VDENEMVDSMSEDSQKQIADECDAIKAILLEKNRAYGNSALEPVRIFSRAATDEQIRVRLDDKLSRLVRGEAAGEDVELDIIGYLVLLRVSRKIEDQRFVAERGEPPVRYSAEDWARHQAEFEALKKETGEPNPTGRLVPRYDSDICGLPNHTGQRCTLPAKHTGYHYHPATGSFSPDSPPAIEAEALEAVDADSTSAGMGLPRDVG